MTNIYIIPPLFSPVRVSGGYNALNESITRQKDVLLPRDAVVDAVRRCGPHAVLTQSLRGPHAVVDLSPSGLIVRHKMTPLNILLTYMMLYASLEGMQIAYHG
jgi:hypothetical protein